MSNPFGEIINSVHDDVKKSHTKIDNLIRHVQRLTHHHHTQSAHHTTKLDKINSTTKDTNDSVKLIDTSNKNTTQLTNQSTTIPTSPYSNPRELLKNVIQADINNFITDITRSYELNQKYPDENKKVVTNCGVSGQPQCQTSIIDTVNDTVLIPVVLSPFTKIYSYLSINTPFGSNLIGFLYLVILWGLFNYQNDKSPPPLDTTNQSEMYKQVLSRLNTLNVQLDTYYLSQEEFIKEFGTSTVSTPDNTIKNSEQYKALTKAGTDIYENISVLSKTLNNLYKSFTNSDI